jgi:AraC-like DNA-binding protein
VAHAYPQWKGFECAPEGHLLDQLIDLSGPMGIAYERSVGFRKDFHAHDRPMIVLPRGSCVATVQIAGDRTETHRIGAAVGLIVPSRVEHEDQAVTSIFDALALFPSLSLVTTVADDEGFPRASLTKLMSRPREFRRSAWLDRLAQEYVFARVVSRRESVKTRAFFERQLLVEILETALGRGKVLAQPRLAPDDTVMGRAVRYIEANLFSDVSLPTLAHHAFASPSTILRHFRRDTGKTPHAYVRVRRLEEARRLLEAGTHAIGDIGLLVGYENFAAFTTAFTRHFGAPPSSFRGRTQYSGRTRPPTRASRHVGRAGSS